MSSYFQRYHPEVILDDYDLDKQRLEVTGHYITTPDDELFEHYGGTYSFARVDDWRAITYGQCEFCHQFPATTHFHHTVDGRYAGLCEQCAREGIDS